MAGYVFPAPQVSWFIEFGLQTRGILESLLGVGTRVGDPVRE